MLQSMKAKSYYLISDQIANNACDDIQSRPRDGKTKVTISGAAKKSDRQRGLQWVWYKDVVDSGIGGDMEETTKKVSILAKLLFGLPIMRANVEKYEEFIDLYLTVNQAKAMDEKAMHFFIHNSMHTEWFDTSEMAQFLTAFQVYYLNKGATLSDPMDKKLLDWKR